MPEEGAEVTAIHITDPSSGELVLEQGEEYMIKYKVEPKGLRRPKISWSIADKNLAYVNNGKITAMKPGQTTVTISSAKVYSEVALTVKPIQINDFTVPKTLSMNVGDRLPVDVTVVPDKANASCLDWKILDSDVASIVMEEGNVFVSGLKDGITKIIVSGGSKTAEIDVIVFKTRYDFTYMNLQTLNNITVADQMHLQLKEIKGYKTLEHVFFFQLQPAVNLQVSDCEVVVDDQEICAAEFRQDQYNLPVVNLVLKEGSKFGETAVHFTFHDREKDAEFKRDFFVKRLNTFLPTSKIYLNNSSFPVGETQVFYGPYELCSLQIDEEGVIPAKWTSSNSDVVRLEDNKHEDATGKLLTRVGMVPGMFGQTMITAEDAEGNQLSFLLVYKPLRLPRDLKARWRHNKNYLSETEENLLPLPPQLEWILDLTSNDIKADEIFVEKWYSDNPNVLSISESGPNWCSITPKSEGIARLYLQDYSGKEFRYTFLVRKSLQGLSLALDYGNGYNDGGTQREVAMRWGDNSTSYRKRVYLVDENMKHVDRHIYKAYCNNNSIEASNFDFSEFDLNTGGGYFTFEGVPWIWEISLHDEFGYSVSKTFRAHYSWEDPWELYLVKYKKFRDPIYNKLSFSNENSFKWAGMDSDFKYDLMLCYKGTKNKIDMDLSIINDDGTLSPTSYKELESYAWHHNMRVKFSIKDMYGKTKTVKLKYNK